MVNVYSIALWLLSTVVVMGRGAREWQGSRRFLLLKKQVVAAFGFFIYDVLLDLSVSVSVWQLFELGGRYTQLSVLDFFSFCRAIMVRMLNRTQMSRPSV